MEAMIADLETTPTSKEYSSRPGALIWFFRKSRDGWKSKYQVLKAEVKGYKNSVAAVTKSRDEWRLKAERFGERLEALEEESATLREAIAVQAEKKTAQDVPALIFDPDERLPARGQQYPIGVVRWALLFVLKCSASLRCAANVLGLLGEETGHDDLAPDRSTCRLWMLRVGLWALLCPKRVADDWVWMIDHSIQIGQCKCLVILGIRLSTLPANRPLVHEDMELIALVPMTQSKKESVAVCLEEAVPRTGVPRAILTDHGADLHGGVELFRHDHPETIELYDIKHKAACLLKARLEHDEQWKSYASESGKAKCAMQQTEMASIVPPSQRTKSRFMNLASLVSWGQSMLVLVDNPSTLEDSGITADRVQTKLDWVPEFRDPLEQWAGYHEQIGATLDFVRDRGLYVGAGAELANALPAASGEVGELREELIMFVTRESSKARIGERLPGSTEVLESCFGKLKALESDQSKSGFTGLVLSLGAMVSKHTTETVREALEQCRSSDVWNWCNKMLGQSVQSRRAQAFLALEGATKTG